MHPTAIRQLLLRKKICRRVQHRGLDARLLAAGMGVHVVKK